VKRGELFAFAGLSEFWKSPEGEPVESCAIVTTDANDVLRQVQ
jgi:putative SOS response-associated peptidase YedK